MNAEQPTKDSLHNAALGWFVWNMARIGAGGKFHDIFRKDGKHSVEKRLFG